MKGAGGGLELFFFMMNDVQAKNPRETAPFSLIFFFPFSLSLPIQFFPFPLGLEKGD